MERPCPDCNAPLIEEGSVIETTRGERRYRCDECGGRFRCDASSTLVPIE